MNTLRRALLTPDDRSATARGSQLGANGNNEADSISTGLVLGVRPDAARWSVNFKAGYRVQDDADGAYGGIEFGYAF